MIVQIEPWIDNAELEELKRVIDSTYVVEHKLTKEFEEMTKVLTGARHAIAMCNGTAALYCCLKALNIGEGDEVIVPDLTFVASSNSVIMAGAKPVFCDIAPDTFCIDPHKIEELITPKTKAIMPVHLYGQSTDMKAIKELADKHKLFIVEDAAQGVGVKFNGKHVGTFGELGVLSYYGNKTITCGEGGVVLTNNDNLAEACYRLKNHGRMIKGSFIHDQVGFNFSFTEMQAAIGISQMKKLPLIIERKKQIHELYTKELAGIEQMQSLYYDKRCTPVYWFTSFLTSKANELSEFLKHKEIQTRKFFYPLHLQPCYSNLDFYNQHFPVSELIYNQGISLPSSYQLSVEDQMFVINQIKGFFYENRY